MISTGGSWSVVVLVGAFGLQFFTAILTYGTGFIHLSLLEVYKESDATTSIVGSLFINLMSVTGPLTSYIIDRIGCRVTASLGGILLVVGLIGSHFASSLWALIVTYGIISGLGIGLALIPCPVSVGFAFPKHSGIAMGITTAGVGMGMLASGPIMQYLLDTYGLRGTFLLSAAIASHTIPCGMLLRTPHSKIQKQGKTEERFAYLKTYLTLLKTPAYMCVLLGAVLWNIAYAVIMIHLPNYVVLSGSSRKEASFLFTVIGIGTVLSRIVIGLAIGPNGLDPLLLNFGLSACMGALIVTFPLFVNLSSGPMVFASLYGIYSGGLLVFTVPLCLEIVGARRLNSAIGLWFFLIGLGSLTGPPLIGLVYDITGSFGLSYILSGFCVLLAALLTLVATFWRKLLKNVEEVSPNAEFQLSKECNFTAQDRELSPRDHLDKLITEKNEFASLK